MQDKRTPVWVAARNGHVGALNVLIKAKADVNAVDVVSLIFNLHGIIFIVLNFNISGQKPNGKGSIIC